MKKGFTLIELLVVIAIVGILASVVLAAFDSSKKRAECKETGNCEQVEKDSCERYADFSQKDIPARCVKYFTGQPVSQN